MSNKEQLKTILSKSKQLRKGETKMARIKVNDMEQYETNDSEWFKLEDDGDCASVQFMYKSVDELDVFSCHDTVKYDNGREFHRKVNCNRASYNSPVEDCELCKAGIRCMTQMVLCMYDVNEKKVKIWQRGKQFKRQLDSMFNRYPDLSKVVIDIERNGRKGDMKTVYNLIPNQNIKPVDLTNIEKPNIENVIMTKTNEEMLEYLNTGEFPEEQQQEEQQAPRRSRRTV